MEEFRLILSTKFSINTCSLQQVFQAMHCPSWLIQLCSLYFAALMPQLAERMTTDSFCMPSLVMLDTKPKQLEALRLVGKQAATSYKGPG